MIKCETENLRKEQLCPGQIAGNFYLELKILTTFCCKNCIVHFCIHTKTLEIYFTAENSLESFLCFVLFLFHFNYVAELSKIVLLMKFSSLVNVLRRIACTKFNSEKELLFIDDTR